MRDRTRHRYKRPPKITKKVVMYIVLADDGAYEFGDDERGTAIEMYEGYRENGDRVTLCQCFKGGGYINLMMNYRGR